MAKIYAIKFKLCSSQSPYSLLFSHHSPLRLICLIQKQFFKCSHVQGRQQISLMYLGQQAGVIQLTGQLTIHIASSTTQFQDLQQPRQCDRSHSPTAKSSKSDKSGKSEEELFHQTRSGLQSRSSEAEEQNIRNPLFERLQDSVKTLEKRIHKMELSSENALKVNEQTLETCQHLRGQIINKLNSHDESFLQRMRNLAEIEKKWAAKSQEAEVKLQKRRQEVENEMKRKMKKLLKEQRTQAEQASRHKLEQLSRELQKQKTQACEQIKKAQEKWEQKSGEKLQEKLEPNLEERSETEIKEVVEVEQKEKKDLEERISLRIKEGAEVVEVLSNKIAELQEKSEEQESNEQRRKEKEKVERGEEMERTVEKKKQASENLLDWRTPFAYLFLAQGNNITFEGKGSHQALLDVVVQRGRTFFLHATITKTEKGNIMIGVVDRLLKDKNKGLMIHAMQFVSVGYINYGEKSKYNKTQAGIKLKTGMEVEMEVDLNKGTVGFAFLKGSSDWEHERQFRQQKSDILTQPHREFVPYFEMHNKKDSIRWNLK